MLEEWRQNWDLSCVENEGRQNHSAEILHQEVSFSFVW